MTHRAEIYQGFYRDLTRITISDIKSEWIWHHTSRNNIRKKTQDYQVRCITIYFGVFHGYERFCCIRYTASTNSTYYVILYLQTHTNHVCDYNTLDSTSMTHTVGIYYGADVYPRDLTRITDSGFKSEWIWHHISGNNNRKKDTVLTGTMHCDIFPRITRLQTVLLHSIHCNYEFRRLQCITYEDTY